MLAPQRFVTILSPLVIVGSASFIVGVAATYAYTVIQHHARSEYMTVEQSSLVQTIRATGTLRPTESIALSFHRAGTLNRVEVGVGSRVAYKQRLATISSGNLPAQLEAAKAKVVAETAELARLQSGDAATGLSTARSAVAERIRASYSVADDAVKVQAGEIVRPNTSPRLPFTTSSSTLEQSVLSERVLMDTLLAEWQAALPAEETQATSSSLTEAATAAADYLSGVETFLSHTATLLVYAAPSASVPAADLEKFRDTISQARLSVAGSLTELTAAAGKLLVAEITSGPQAIEAAKAAVAAAEARVQALEAEISETRLIAPIAGTIVQQYARAGTAVASGETVFFMSSDARAEMVAALPAAEAAKIHVGDNAQVYLDGYPDRTFAAQIVATAAPAAASQQDTHTVTVQLTDAGGELSFGMAGAIAITTAATKEALMVPASAVIIKDGQPSVLRAAGNRDELVPVTTGITTNSGEVEIVAGLSAGDKIRTSVSVY